MTGLRSLLTDDGFADPYPVYAELRAAEAAGEEIGRVVVGYEQVAEALASRTLSSDRIPGLMADLPPAVRPEISLVERTLRSIVAFQDPPDHTRLRGLMAKALTPRVVRQQRPAIERVTRHLLDRFPDGAAGPDAPLDLVAALTFPLPAMVIAALIGVPDTEFDRFQRWANDIVFFVGSGELDESLALRTRDGMLEMREYLADLAARRRRQPGDDLLSEMIAVTDQGDRLTEDELFANTVFLMTAGHETATNMLGNGLLTLLRHRDQLDRLGAEPELIETATEEILRFESPVQITARFVTVDGDHLGRRLTAGDALTLVLGAANRDPAVFADPDRFDIARAGPRHLAFALGPHFCLGAPLARLEMQLVVPMVFDRFPDLDLTDEPIEWQRTLSFRGPTRLPVTW